MTFTHAIRGFDRYLVSKEGYILRNRYVTSDLKYKAPRFIDFDKNNRVYLYNNFTSWRPTKIKLRGSLYRIQPIHMGTKSIIPKYPF